MEEGIKKTMCPAFKGSEGAQLLGIRQDDGTIAILPQALPVDNAFLQKASQNGKPEEQFRFTGRCIEGGCQQWTGKRCGVADRVLDFIEQIETTYTLQPCPIRPSCRWYLQNKADACRICTYVVTEISAIEIEQYIKDK